MDFINNLTNPSLVELSALTIFIFRTENHQILFTNKKKPPSMKEANFTF
jgi:hypothetical protein